jgi:hypothetical protein
VVAASSVVLPAAPLSAQVITITEGESTVVSGGAGYRAVPGVRLSACDIISTGPKGLAQVEMKDGGKIVMGPDSRFVFDVPHSGASVVGPNFLVSGWAKVTVPKRDKGLPYRVDTPHLDVQTEDGVAVLRVGANGATFFVEQGAATAVLPAGVRTDVAAGRAYDIKAGQPRGAVEDRVPADFVQSMPPSFRDTLPSLLQQIESRNVKSKPAPDQRPSDHLAWMQDVPALRVCFSDVTVLSAQRALERNGFDVGPIDGILGRRTQAAVRAFQQHRGLASSGRLDGDTLKALEVEEQR